MSSLLLLHRLFRSQNGLQGELNCCGVAGGWIAIDLTVKALEALGDLLELRILWVGNGELHEHLR